MTNQSYLPEKKQAFLKHDRVSHPIVKRKRKPPETGYVCQLGNIFTNSAIDSIQDDSS